MAELPGNWTEFPDVVRAANATARPFDRDATVPDLLDAAAEQYPDRVALRTRQGTTVTHRQVRERSTALANLLAGHGVRRGTPVGVLLDHDPESIVAIIAVVRAGGYYVPLDPRWSCERMVELLTSLGASALVVSPALARRAFEIAPAVPGLDLVVCNDGADGPAGEAPGAADLASVAELWDGIAASPDECRAAGFNLDRRGYRYSPQQVADYAGYVAGLVREHCRPGERVVEIGAGSGLITRQIAAGGTPVLALDPAPGAMAALALRARDTGLPITTGVRAAHDAVTAIDAPDHVGVVLLAATVQYFPDPHYLRQTLHSLLTGLAPGTRIVVADLIDPMSGQFPGGLRVPRTWWSAWAEGYPGQLVRALPPRTAEVLDSPLRHRYDVVITVPAAVPAEQPEPAPGSGERPWRWHELPAGSVAAPPAAGDLAYTIATSGSTGTPKAVAVRHRSVVNLVDWFNRRNEVTCADVMSQVAALTFDLSVYDIFGVLAAGGSLLLLPDREMADPDNLVEALLEDGVTLWNSAPAAFSMLLPLLRSRPPHGRNRLRRVFLSGDWVPLTTHADLAREFPNAVLVALGGATEACVWSNDFVVTGVDPEWASIPYGHPMQNSRYYVLRQDGTPCAVGEAGELHIAGECVADGYLNDPRLSAERFVRDPWASDPTERMYRTGDRARWTEHGWVEFLGRVDHQVKVNGFRIELGEVEHVAGRLSGVGEAVAVTYGPAREPRLGLAVRATGLSEQDLHDHLATHLPSYMLPSRLRVLDSLPVSATGKVDRRAVSALMVAEPATGRSGSRRGGPAPLGELLVLCRAFADVLGVAEVHPDDDLFEIGGNSLQAVRLTASLRRHHGLPVIGTDVFDHSSPRSLLTRLATSGAPAH